MKFKDILKKAFKIKAASNPILAGVVGVANEFLADDKKIDINSTGEEIDEAISKLPLKKQEIIAEKIDKDILGILSADVKDARMMYKVNPQQADKVAEYVMKYNLVIIVVLVVVNLLAVYFLRDSASLVALVSNIIGIAMASLINERAQVNGFYFGSSLGSKIKGEN